MKTINTIWMKPLLMVCGAFVLALNMQAQTPACSVEHRQLWICAGDDFMFHGKKVPVPGTYSDTLKDVSGCDSVILYDVNVTATFHWVDYANISDQSKFPWHGEEYTQSGIYEKVYKSIHDCDSTYELHLTVWPTYHFYDTLAVCENA
ncbi:MAG: hypothetical protein J6T32_01995, partial [Paludibacteraceae bacterium]|nr:hypothetical protein [Paludibacteraceae bacterium]